MTLDARHVKAALSLRLNKTDANDAEGLAQIVRTGWYRQVQVKSLDSHLIRTLLAARAGLVAMHRDVANQIRGALKTFGLVLGKVAAGAFEARVRQLIAGNPLLVEVVEALLKVWRTTGEQLVTLHRRRMRWLSRLLTCTWRYQPVRTICASPSASLASVLLSRNDKAPLTWRASRQTTGRPSALSACQCQVDSSPLSRPIRVAPGALRVRTAAVLSGVDAHLPCHRVVPVCSTTQRLVSWRCNLTSGNSVGEGALRQTGCSECREGRPDVADPGYDRGRSHGTAHRRRP